MKNAIDKIKHGIEQYRGIFKIKMEPKVVTEVDDVALQVSLLDQLLKIDGQM